MTPEAADDGRPSSSDVVDPTAARQPEPSDVVAWVDARLGEVGRRRTGELTVSRRRAWGTVMRAETDLGAAWLKIPAAATVFEVALYPVLHRLEKQGWVRAEWRQTESNQRAKFYSLTPAGRKQLTQEHARWKQMVQAISSIMDTAS